MGLENAKRVGNVEPISNMRITVKLDQEYNFLVKKFAEFLTKELCILPRHILITDYDIESSSGMCIDDNDGKYVILVNYTNRNIGEVFTTVAHEMIHVKQYMTQDLGRLLDENEDLPYEQRWWEKEAFSNAVPLVEKFASTINLKK